MPESKEGRIEISRPPVWVSSFRAYSIYLDGMKVRRIKNGEEIAIPASAGIHKVWLKIDWLQSNSVQIDIVPNETVRLVTGYNQKKGFKYWGALLVFAILIAVGAAFGSLFGGLLFGMAGIAYAQYFSRPQLRKILDPK